MENISTEGIPPFLSLAHSCYFVFSWIIGSRACVGPSSSPRRPQNAAHARGGRPKARNPRGKGAEVTSSSREHPSAANSVTRRPPRPHPRPWHPHNPPCQEDGVCARPRVSPAPVRPESWSITSEYTIGNPPMDLGRLLRFWTNFAPKMPPRTTYLGSFQ